MVYIHSFVDGYITYNIVRSINSFVQVNRIAAVVVAIVLLFLADTPHSDPFPSLILFVK